MLAAGGEESGSPKGLADSQGSAGIGAGMAEESSYQKLMWEMRLFKDWMT